MNNWLWMISINYCKTTQRFANVSLELNLNFWKPYRIGGSIEKAQNHKDSLLQENPTSNQGLDDEYSISN